MLTEAVTVEPMVAAFVREKPAYTFLTLTSNRQFERRFARSPLLRAGRRKVMERIRKSDR
jgi:hypothetical protein